MDCCPTISVIIPAYNRPAELRRALSSLIAQTCQEFEVIVCDDGSQEDIARVVRDIKNHLDITFLRIENSGGPARPRNVAIEHSRNEWISFLDSDDWWLPNRIEEVTKAINESGIRGVVYHRLMIARHTRKRYWWASPVVGSAVGRNPFVHLLTYGNCLPNSAVVIHRSWIDKVGKWNESKDYASVEDFDYWLKLAKNGAPFFFIDKALGYYWLASDGISADPKKNIEKNIRVFESYIPELGQQDSRVARSYLSYLIGTFYQNLGQPEVAFGYYCAARYLPSLELKVKCFFKMLFARFKSGVRLA